jgi:basic membrane protein A
MLKKYLVTFLTILMVFSLLAACAPQAAEEATVEEAAQPEVEEVAAEVEEEVAEEAVEEELLKVVYITPSPIGVNQFLTLGQDGMDRLAKEYGVEINTVESSDPTDRAENVRAMVREGWDIIVLLGFDFQDIVAEIAPESPDITFVTVDFCPNPLPENVRCGVFREHEGAFLIGAVAGLATESNVVGTVAALDTPFIRRWPDGFAQGAQYVNPDVEVVTLFVGGFADPAKAKELALSMTADGADHIFAAAAGGNFGVFEAAKAESFFTYGVDTNQCPNDPQNVMENLIKRVDEAVFQTVEAIIQESEQQVFDYGLAENGVGLTILTSDDPDSTECAILGYPGVIEEVTEIRQMIIDGEIEVIDPLSAGN